MKRKLIALVLVLCVTAFLGTVCAGAASGSCGTGVTWVYDESTGTLTVSGSGAMQDFYAASYTPWYAYKTGITSVVIGEGVTAIGSNAFGNFSKLSSVSIASTVTSIGKSAFFMCRSLTEVSIPSATATIGASAFFGCSKLTAITVAAGNSNFCSDASGVLYNRAKTVLIQAPGALSGSYTVAAGVTQISGQAFYGCSGLNGISLPEGLTQIGSAAFQNCTKLKAVAVPQTVTSIGDGAFLGCAALTGITVDASNGYYSSDDCGVLFNKQKTLLIQAPGALSGSYVLPASVKQIGDNAFWCCEALTQVRLPVGLQTMGEAAFSSCYSLESVNIPGTVTAIPAEAFSGCFALAEISIPGSVTAIGKHAFASCESLTEITFAGGAPAIADTAFADVYAVAYYPAGSTTWTDAMRANYGGELEWQTISLFDVDAVSMTLGNDLTMYFWVSQANVADTAGYVQITKTYADGREDVVKQVAISDCASGYGYYLVPFNGISAKEMTDTLYATVYDSNDVAVSNPYETSIESYALDMLRDADSTDALKTVIVDMLNYGAAAQTEFGYNTAAPANANMTEAEAAYATAEFDVTALDAKAVDGEAGMGVTMTLKSSIVLNVFLDPSIVITDMTAKISYTNHNSKAVSYEIPGSEFVALGSDYLYLNVDTLAASDIETVVTVEIYDGTTLVSTSQYNMASYCVDNASQPIVVALAKFCASANAYFHS